jgi:hypothetical protein
MNPAEAQFLALGVPDLFLEAYAPADYIDRHAGRIAVGNRRPAWREPAEGEYRVCGSGAAGRDLLRWPHLAL